MNKVNDNLNFYGSYFRGVHDIIEHKSFGKVSLGVLKVVSYATIALPIIFGIGYLYASSKLNKLSNLYNRVTESLSPDFRGEMPTQENYIKFLAGKIQDKEYSSFDYGFRALEPASQRLFFAAMAKEGCLIETMGQLPKDLTQVEFNLGNFLSVWSFEKANNLVKEFLTKLDSFKNLKELVVDLSGIAYYTVSAQNFLKLMSEFKSSGYYSSRLEVDGVPLSRTYSEPNNLGAAKTALQGLVNHLRQNKELKFIDVIFRDRKVTIKKDENSPLLLMLESSI